MDKTGTKQASGVIEKGKRGCRVHSEVQKGWARFAARFVGKTVFDHQVGD